MNDSQTVKWMHLTHDVAKYLSKHVIYKSQNEIERKFKGVLGSWYTVKRYQSDWTKINGTKF